MKNFKVMKKVILLVSAMLLMLALGFLLQSCDKGTGPNVFRVSQDIELGEDMDSIIRSDPAEYPILDPTAYPEAYAFMNSMMNRLLQSDDFAHKDDFNFRITIINKDVMNAFAVPGGNLYFYTGLMKYLDNEANLAGVLAHEMAHVDRRHSTQQLTYAMGINTALSVLLGKDKSQFATYAQNLATGLASLQFSKKDEYEADEYSIRYMHDTKYYQPDGIKGFFVKLEEEGKSGDNFAFLSTHPSDADRIANIEEIVNGLSNIEGEYYESEYQNFLSNMLP